MGEGGRRKRGKVDERQGHEEMKEKGQEGGDVNKKEGWMLNERRL